MKKLVSLLLVVITLFTLASCSISEAIAEKVQEKVIENMAGDGADVDIDGEKFSYKDKDGNKVEIGSTKWPTGKAADIIPKFDKGKITSVISMDKGCSINIENVQKKDFESYLALVKSKGFTDDAIELNSDGVIAYQANAGETKSIAISYEADTEVLFIMGSIIE